MLTKATHEWLWLGIKAVAVIVAARMTRNTFEWLVLAAIFVMFLNHWEKMSEAKHTMSESEEMARHREKVARRLRKRNGE